MSVEKVESFYVLYNEKTGEYYTGAKDNEILDPEFAFRCCDFNTAKKTQNDCLVEENGIFYTIKKVEIRVFDL